jgi:multidrug efflux pump
VPIININSADSQFAAAYLSFTSDILEANQITDYLVRVVQPRLSALAGVQRADILGGRTFAMRIWLKPDLMAALGVSPAQVRGALVANNFLSAVGRTKGSLVQVNLTANTDLRSVEEFRELVVRRSGDSLVRLRDIADVVLGAEDYNSEVRFSGERAVFMGVWPLPNANSLDVIRLVRAEMDAIQKELPTGLSGRIAYDATKYIEDAIHEVLKTLSETLLIVAIVIFLFLGSVRSVLIPLVAIPISLIGGIFLMQVFGFTINLLTLLAIVLSVGLVVDDAIVIVENVERHVREGKSPRQAALLGARELVSPVIAMTITLAAVYAPIGLQGGLTGSLFREFAFTLAGAVFISGIVALTLSPVMSSKLLDAGREDHGLTGRINRGFDRLKRGYGRVLDGTLSARPAVYVVWLGLSLLSIPMFMSAPKELAPPEDQSVAFGIVEAPADATIDQTVFYAEEMNRVLMSTPERSQTFQITFPDNGFSGMVLKPWGERKRTVFEVTPEVQAKISQIPGVRAMLATPPALPGGGQFPVEVVIASTADPQTILEFVDKIQERAATSGMFAFPPIIDTKIDQPEVELVMDRDKVASLGLNMATIGEDLAALVGGNFVNRFSFEGRSYKVIPQIARTQRLNASQLEYTYVRGPDGQLVQLSTFATLQKKTVPRSLHRFQQFNSVKISGVAIRPLNDALKFIEEEAARTLPKGYKLDYTGESRQLRVEGSKFLPAFALALTLIFLVLAAQFNSFRDPLIILLGSVPLAMFGALIFSFLKMPDPNTPFFTKGWTTTLNIYSQVGLVTLIGLVSKNGILIVEFANALQRRGLTKLQAARESAMVRLRPVLMTSAATICGHFPNARERCRSGGAEFYRYYYCSGHGFGAIFTLLVIPAIYVLIAKQHTGEEAGAIARDVELADAHGLASSGNSCPQVATAGKPHITLWRP